jgi:hypothetical protein
VLHLKGDVLIPAGEAFFSEAEQTIQGKWGGISADVIKGKIRKETRKRGWNEEETRRGEKKGNLMLKWGKISAKRHIYR